MKPLNLSGQSGEVKALGGYDESSLEEVLRSLCSSGPVSLFSLLDCVGLPSTAETFAELTSFVKQRSHIFHLSNDLFGHTVSLVREPFPDATDDHSEKALELISETGQEGEMSGTQLGPCAEESASVAPVALSSHLYSVLCQHGGSLSLARLEWDEVCVAEFVSAVDLENYLCQQPEHFLVWDSDDGKMVSAVSPTNHEPTILKLSEAMNSEEPTVLNLSEVLPAAKASSAEVSTGSRWGKAMRQMEEEKVQVLEDDTDLEECMASAGSHQARVHWQVERSGIYMLWNFKVNSEGLNGLKWLQDLLGRSFILMTLLQMCDSKQLKRCGCLGRMIHSLL